MSISLARLARPSLATAILRPSQHISTTRSYASQIPGQPKNKASGNNRLLLIATGTAAAAGLYWYYTHPDDVKRADERVKQAEEQVAFKTREIVDAGKARSQGVVTQGKEKYEDVLASGKEKLASARAVAEEAEARARQEAAGAQAQVEETKAKLEQKYKETKVEAEKVGHDAKAGWSSWWRWGSTKADETKKSGAAKVAGVAEDAKKEAEKRS